MKVKEVMTSDVKSCSLDTNLAAAAKIMWEGDCGAVPVTDEGGKVVGVITDRDICIAGATRDRTEGEIPVREVISRTLYACTPGDDVRAALDTMKAEQVRRLPVVGQDGRLTGIVSIHDIAVEARPNKNSGLRAEDVLETFIAITAPQRERMIAS
jgi:CBS domain-containing protein